MALSQDLARRSQNRGVEALLATAATTYFAGALVGVDTSTGRAVLWADTANFRFMGVVERRFPLTAFGIVTTTPDEVEINTSGVILENVSIVGVADQTNVGDLVFATDDGTFTLTPTVNVDAIGVITRWRVSTFADVKLFTPTEYLIQ